MINKGCKYLKAQENIVITIINHSEGIGSENKTNF